MNNPRDYKLTPEESRTATAFGMDEADIDVVVKTVGPAIANLGVPLGAVMIALSSLLLDTLERLPPDYQQAHLQTMAEALGYKIRFED